MKIFLVYFKKTFNHEKNSNYYMYFGDYEMFLADVANYSY